jgi:hypothetical protein
VLEIIVVHGGAGDSGNGQSGVKAAIVKSVNIRPVEDIGVFAIAVAMGIIGVKGACGIDEAGGIVV